MASAPELAETALALARQCLDAHRDTLLRLADGDADLLRLAAEQVRARHAGLPETTRTTEHLAFSLLTAAFVALTQQRATPTETERQHHGDGA